MYILKMDPIYYPEQALRNLKKAMEGFIRKGEDTPWPDTDLMILSVKTLLEMSPCKDLVNTEDFLIVILIKGVEGGYEASPFPSLEVEVKEKMNMDLDDLSWVGVFRSPVLDGLGVFSSSPRDKIPNEVIERMETERLISQKTNAPTTKTLH